MEIAIEQIRDGKQPIRKVAAWLENETGRKLSSPRLHKLAWSSEELEERRKKRRRKFTPEQRRLQDLKDQERQSRIKHGIAERKLQRAVKKTRPDSVNPSLNFSDVSGESREVAFRANPGPQTEFLSSTEREVFYGGARGGGKTYSLW